MEWLSFWINVGLKDEMRPPNRALSLQKNAHSADGTMTQLQKNKSEGLIQWHGPQVQEYRAKLLHHQNRTITVPLGPEKEATLQFHKQTVIN